MVQLKYIVAQLRGRIPIGVVAAAPSPLHVHRGRPLVAFALDISMAFIEFTGISVRTICSSLASFVGGIREEGRPTVPRENVTTDCRDHPLLNEFETENLRKSAKFMDFSPQNGRSCAYCHDLINVRIRGQAKGKHDGRNDAFDGAAVSRDLSLPLRQAHGILERLQADLKGDEEEFMLAMEDIYRARFPDDERKREKFHLDCEEFLKVFRQRQDMPASLRHGEYWGTRQQLLSGKVIADHVAPDYGALDPVFGVLLHPTSGRTGPGDSGYIHNLLFDGDGPIAYHSAVHDAFGYLLEAHGVGPGYDYLGSWSIFNSRLPLSGQLSGIKFWDQALTSQKSCACKEI